MSIKDPIIRKTRTIFDESTGAWLDEYEARGLTQATIKISVPREEKSAKRISATLLKFGGRRLSEEEEQTLISAIDEEAEVTRMVAATGWQDERRAFARHDIVRDIDRTGRPLMPPVWAGVALAARLGRSGSVEDAAKFLTRSAKRSSACILAMGAVFGAPLLSILNLGPFALVLVAPSRFGKSSAQLIAGSIIGYGREEDLPNLNATEAGLLAAVRTFNDHAFPLNEVGTIKGKKAEIYVTLRDCTYQLMSGSEIMRHPIWQGDASPLASTFRSIILMSSEHSPDVWAARNGVERDDGEKVRLIGVPLAIDGAKSIFDHPPVSSNPKQGRKWVRSRFTSLRSNSASNHGVLFDEYIDHLLKSRKTLESTVRNYINIFEAHLKIDTRSVIEAAIIKSFAVLFAGCAEAIEAGLLDVKRDLVGERLKALCLAALSSLPDPEEELRRDLAKLRRWARKEAIDTARQANGKAYRNASGWRQTERKKVRLVIRSQAFTKLINRPTRLSRALSWLDEQGFLDTSKAGRPTKGRAVDWAQRQIDWPDGTRPRSIVINLPRGLGDLELR